MVNIANTVEYKNYRDKYEYIFIDEFEIGKSEIQISESDLILKISKYCDDSLKKHNHRVLTSITRVFRSDGSFVIEFKNIDNQVDLYKVINHKNGSNYLLYSIELYGYCVLDLRSSENYCFIPDKTINNGESLIWLDAIYNAESDFIAVEGTYWASPASTSIFDFSDPSKLPLREILNSYELSSELNIDEDVIPILWEGKNIILECNIQGEGALTRKSFDLSDY